MKQPKCGDCWYFSPQHQCCTTRFKNLDGLDVLVAVTETSLACIDINKPDLRNLVTTQRISEVSGMIDDDDRDWQGVPVLQVFVQSGGLRIIGTVDGLTDLLTAIARAMGKGNSSVELVSSESDVYPVMVERRDLASEWSNLPSPVVNTEPSGDDGLDSLDFRENF